MTLQSDLDQITVNANTSATNNAQSFLASSGRAGIVGFMSYMASLGKRTAGFHISNGKNPSAINHGFATSTGELSIINTPLNPGVQDRNGIAWIYLNMETATQAEFVSTVNTLITGLATTDGLTITSQIGATMADFQASW